MEKKHVEIYFLCPVCKTFIPFEIFLCSSCGAVIDYDEDEEKYYVSSYICSKCGVANDIGRTTCEKCRPENVPPDSRD
ncbi:MAG: hypothetical protein WC405_21455 [Syntrophales bacterium]